MVLGPGDAGRLDMVADGVFDRPPRRELTLEFLGDPRHHMVVAVEGGRVIGMASGVHYLHPDKDPELWINEVGVAPSHRGLGVGRRLMRALLEVGRAVGCVEAWVLTERQNRAAVGLYTALGGAKGPGDTMMLVFKLAVEEERDP